MAEPDVALRGPRGSRVWDFSCSQSVKAWQKATAGRMEWHVAHRPPTHLMILVGLRMSLSPQNLKPSALNLLLRVVRMGVPMKLASGAQPIN